MGLDESMKAYAEARGIPWYGPEHELSAWARGMITEYQRMAAAGEFILCEHLAEFVAENKGRTVTPPKAAVVKWLPEALCCTLCLEPLLLSGFTERVCDRCGSNIESGGHNCMLNVDDTLLVWRSCDPCYALEVPESEVA